MPDRPDLHALARRVLRDSPGDGLGVAYDLDAQLDVAETAAARWLASRSPAHLTEWGDVMTAIGEVGESAEGDARSRFDVLRRLLALA